jgi:hypothetical protein
MDFLKRFIFFVFFWIGQYPYILPSRARGRFADWGTSNPGQEAPRTVRGLQPTSLNEEDACRSAHCWGFGHDSE